MKNYKEFKEMYPIQLNEQQEKAVRRTTGQTLLLAVPGSGKTTVIICRIGYLLKVEAIDPSKILTLTFSRMGAKDLKKRYETIFGEARNLNFSTIHSFSLSIIRYYERFFSRQAYDVLGNVTPVIRDLYRHLFKGFPGEIELGEIVQQISYCKNMLLTKKEIALLPSMEVDFVKIYEAYESYKIKHHLMDFDDILKYAWGLLKKYPEILNFFREKYPYIHIDEAQDTSIIQFNILELLTGEKGNLFMVGDEDQSIYGFRGAHPKSLLTFKQTWSEGEVLLMEMNYRSTRQIVEYSNRFIKLNTERYAKEMVTNNEFGPPIVREWIKSNETQYQLIIEAIKKEGKEIAVLYRNNESAIPLIDLLNRENIPYHIKEHNPLFFTHFLIKDIRLFYEFSIDLSDYDLFLQICFKMDAAISRDTVNQLKLRLRPGENIFDALMVLSKNSAPWQIKRLKELKEGFHRLEKLSPKKGLDLILEQLGYRGYLDFRISSGQSEESIQQKLTVLKTLGGRVKSFDEFFINLDHLEKSLKETPSHKNKKIQVILSTLHSSKGLEFEKVFMIDIVEGQIPSMESMEPGKEALYAEEVRLFYVGVTRAKKELVIICSQSSAKCGKPSPFIKYLVDGLPKEKRSRLKKQKLSTNQGSREIQTFGSNGCKWDNYKGGEMEEVEMDLSMFKSGTFITHDHFGPGLILERDGAIASIQFDQAGVKKMNLGICLNNGVIKP